MPTIPQPSNDQQARASARALHDLQTRQGRIAALEADSTATPTLHQSYALHILRQLHAAHAVGHAPWRGHWRRESRAQAMRRTRDARARADMKAAA